MHRIIHIEADAPLKPVEGKPCNGCGVCCLAEPCPVGMVISRKILGSCSALQWVADERRYRCGLLASPAAHFRWKWLSRIGMPWARRMISAGSGCDSSIVVGDGPTAA